MKKLSQIDENLMEELSNVKQDEDIHNLGFECKGKLCEYEGYEDFYERLWAWTKVKNDNIYIVITADTGNCFCGIVYTDLYVKEIINDINSGKSNLENYQKNYNDLTNKFTEEHKPKKVIRIWNSDDFFVKLDSKWYLISSEIIGSKDCDTELLEGLENGATVYSSAVFG